MNSAVLHFEPKILIAGIDSFDLADPPLDGSREEAQEQPIDWDDMDFQVQGLLSKLFRSVKRALPDVRQLRGKTTGRIFYLYSYCSFQLDDDPDFESLVIGVMFEPCEKGLRVRGEIGGEESGRSDFDSTTVETALEFSKAAAAARRIVIELESQTDLIVRRLIERHPVPEY